MKKLNDIEQLDALFKQHLDKAQVPAPPEVWSSVASSAGVQSASTLSQFSTYFSSLTNIVKLALFVGGTVTVGVLLYKANTEPAPKSDNIEETITEPLSGEENSSETYTEEIVNEGVSNNTETSSVENNTANPSNTNGSNNPSNQNNDPRLGSETDHSTPAQNNDNPDNSPTIAIPLALSIVTSNETTCIGQTKTFSSNDRTKGDWYINNKLVKKESEVMSHRFAEKGQFTIELRAKHAKAIHTLDVKSSDANIQVKDLQNGQYELSLSDSKLKVSQWTMNGSSLSTAQTVNARLQSGTVHIAARASDGECAYTVEKTIEIKSKGSFSSPNIFTPNGDGKNDEYLVKITNYQSFSMVIFDDKNNRVFETRDPQQGWNGRISNIGEACTDGIYIVRISYTLDGEAPESKLIKLTLKR